MAHQGSAYRRRDDFRGYDDRDRYQKRTRYDDDPRSRQGRGGYDQATLDEDILVCPNYNNWRNRALPEATVDDYSKFVQDWLKTRNDTFAERHWKEDWYLERYDPLRAEEKHKERLSGVLKRAETIDVAALIELKVSSSSSILYGPEPLQVPESRSVYVPNIPALVPKTAIEKLFHAEKAEHILFSDVNRARKRRDLGRRAIVVFKEVQHAKECLAKGSLTCWLTVDADGVYSDGTAVKDDQRTDVTIRVVAFKPFPNRILPAESLTEARLKKDEEQSLACAEALDEVNQVKAEHGVKSFLARRPDNVSQLDATIQYLRYVHLFCYYSGILARDFGELVHKAAAPFLRPVTGPSDRDVPASIGGSGEDEDGQTTDPAKFYETIDLTVSKVCERFKESYTAERAFMQEALARREKLAGEAFDYFVKKALVMKGDHVYCAFHDKLFQNETFFRKHLHNFHGAAVRSDIRRALYPLMSELFVRDEEKPLPRLQRFVEEVLQGTFVPTEASSNRGSDSYQQRRADGPRSSYRGDAQSSRRWDDASVPPPSLVAAPVLPPIRKYRDPDAPQEPAEATSKPKLQYRTRVSYE